MKKLYCLLSVFSLLFCSGCNQWLDVTPDGQVEADDLYTTTKGCNAVVGGIYHTFSGSSLYGQNLSYGIVDVLAQYWDFSSNYSSTHLYRKASTYDYADKAIVGLFESIWHDFYYAITQCNAFIEFSAPHRGNIANYDLLLGEVYGLRALAHLELFELFGPVIRDVADLQKKAIAYRTEYNNVSKDFDSAETVLQKAAEDLTMAVKLLEKDPLRVSQTGRTDDMNSSIFDYQDVLNFRGARMNYFCAVGLLARLELLRKRPEAAYTYAKQVISESEGILGLVDKENIMGPSAVRDNNYSTEMLGAFYVNNLYDMTNAIFGMDGESGNVDETLIITERKLEIWFDNIYNRMPDGSGADNRYIYWFVKDDERGSINFTKYHKPERTGAYYPEVAIMRMSEVYYIACEAQIGKDNPLALGYLNDVRATRGLPSLENITDADLLLEYLVREARKDFIGEGRMFFMYKRLFRDIYVSREITIEADESRFVIPIPDDEYEFAGIDKPTKN